MLLLILFIFYLLVVLAVSRNHALDASKINLELTAGHSADSLLIKTNSPDKLWKYQIHNHPISRFDSGGLKPEPSVTWGRAGADQK